MSSPEQFTTCLNKFRLRSRLARLIPYRDGNTIKVIT
nr:MAG TPA: hypothetical protein [Caudoviricetes sp.]